MNTYLPEGVEADVGSSGFTNYWRGANIEREESMARRVLGDHPDCVIINGTDDWHAPRERRPEHFVHAFMIKPVARFHTGISGISSSGVVVKKVDLDRIEREFEKTFSKKLRDMVRVYE